MWATRFVALAATFPSCACDDARPIIGIVAQPTDGGSRSYIAASYVKFVEAAGARAVPLHYDAPASTLKHLAQSVNGILLPGGAASLKNSSEYYQAGKVLYEAAIEANNAGQHVPIWGTCLGFEQLARLLSGDADATLSSGFDSENYPIPLVPASDTSIRESRIFAGAPPKLLTAVTTENITMNNHHSGVTPENFQQLLAGTVHMISTNVDRQGRPFVSTYESKSYPFYGSQWHPEKNTFEWTVNEAIPHSATAVELEQWVANFFVSEARKNTHRFDSAEEEQAALIYNYKVSFTGKNGSGFEQEYVWPQ